MSPSGQDPDHQSNRQAFNSITKDKEGTPLGGAVFEIYNNKMELVDTVTTDAANVHRAVSKPLAAGRLWHQGDRQPGILLHPMARCFMPRSRSTGNLVKIQVKKHPGRS